MLSMRHLALQRETHFLEGSEATKGEKFASL